jgi:hypothetical protein
LINSFRRSASGKDDEKIAKIPHMVVWCTSGVLWWCQKQQMTLYFAIPTVLHALLVAPTEMPKDADARTGCVIGRKLIAHWTDVRTDIEQHVTKKVSLAEKEVSR